MMTAYLFPNRVKVFGWLLLIPSLLALVIIVITKHEIESNLVTSVFAIVETPIFESTKYWTVIQNSIADELLIIAMICGGILVGFSRTKDEDEYISKIRFESLIWAMYFNFTLMILTTVFFYGFVYFYVLTANVFSMLLFFIIRFHIKLYQLKNADYDE